jgi:hypothetical protein
MPDRPKILTILDDFNRHIDNLEADQMIEMTRRWMQVEDALDYQIKDLADILAQRIKDGKPVTENNIRQLSRWKELLRQAVTEADKYQNYADKLIAANQIEYGRLGLDAAQEVLRLSGVSINFTMLNTDAINNMIGLAGDGSPLFDVLKKRAIAPEMVDGIQSQLIEAIATGINPRKTAELIKDGLSAGLNKALVIARTEQLRAYRQASLDQYQASGVVQSYTRHCALSERTCLACFSGNVIVSGPVPEKVFSRYYSGDIIIIKTSGGKDITVTPNHPILTNGGWVKAGKLRAGDNIIRYTGSDRTLFGVGVNNYQAPIPIENLSKKLGMVHAEMKCSSPYFHGDGIGSDIYTEWTYSLLGNNVDTATSEHVSKFNFSGGRAGPLSILGSFLSSLSVLYSSRICNLTFSVSVLKGWLSFGKRYFGNPKKRSLGNSSYSSSADSNTCYDSLPGNIIESGQFHFSFSGIISACYFIIREIHFRMFNDRRLFSRNSVSFGLCSENSSTLENVDKSSVVDSENWSDLLDRLSGQVSNDSIVDISVSTFSGHVYNLQTKIGWYLANGIIAHNCIALDGKTQKTDELYENHPNCRCFVTPNVEGVSPIQGRSGQAWFDNLSENKQREILGGHYDLYASGVPLLDMVKIKDDPTWGPTIGIKPLSEIE